MKKVVFFLVMIILGLSSAVGAQGNWTLQTNPTSAPGESIQFVSLTEGWISLDTNQLLHTTNSGTSWIPVTPGGSDVSWGMDAPGSRISFISPSTGWALKTLGPDDVPNGAKVYKTTNGGLTWTGTQLSNTAGVGGVQVQFLDANNGWVLIFNMNTGVPTFLKTVDGGSTWTPTGGAGVFEYLNTNVGYAFSAGPDMPPPYVISKTINGGSTWTTVYSDNTVGAINAMDFTDVNNGWVVGNGGKILKTTNGGSTWTSVTPAGITANAEMLTVDFINASIGFIAVRDPSLSSSQHFMLRTTDGGTTWTQQILPFSAKVYAASFWDQNNGWATSDGGSVTTGQIAQYFNSGLSVSDVVKTGDDFVVYPNPTRGSFRFRLDSADWPVQVAIYDTAGRKVYETKINSRGDNMVEFNPQNSGMYFVTVNDGEKMYSRKLIVKKE